MRTPSTRIFGTQALPGKGLANPLRVFLSRLCASVFVVCVIVLLPVSPLLLTLMTGKGKFIRNYYRTIAKLLVTLDALHCQRRHSKPALMPRLI